MLALDKDDVTDCLMGTGINYPSKMHFRNFVNMTDFLHVETTRVKIRG